MRAVVLAMIMALAPSAGLARSDLSAELALTGLAATEARLAAVPAPTPDEAFALGGIRFLRGIERALQARWRTGMNADRSELPILRLPIPNNPEPAPFTPEVVTELFTGITADMAAARAALERTGGGDFGVEIVLGDLWFDINANGRREPGEGVVEVSGLTLAGAGLRGRRPVPFEAATVRFDAADAEWLTAYTHFLSGAANLVLAFDPAPAIAQVIDSAAAMDRLIGDTPPPNALDHLFGRQVDRLMMVWLALARQPDATLTRAARDHLLAMIRHNRLFWAAVEAETDNAAEWVPNDRQQSALGIELPQGTGTRWLAVLADGEALLTGQKLMPHWRFGGAAGINVARMFDDPGPVDPVAWAQGMGLLRWAEPGTRVDANSWRDFEFLVRGDAMLFALFLN